MSGSAGEWTLDQLREAVDDPSGIPPARPATVAVERLERSGHDGGGILVEVAFEQVETVERWRLTFDSMWVDLCDFPLQDAALIARTNIVEWWDTHDREPEPPWLTTERIG